MLKAVIIDDEKNAIDALWDVLAGFEQIEIVHTFTNPLEALRELEKLSCQIVFLDIEMPGMKGLEMAEWIMERKPSVQIVFVTAYNQYAVEAFELHAMDYLLKPVRHERMAKTVQRLITDVQAECQHETKQHPNEGRIACFGAFQIVVNSERIEHVKWRTNKVRELFAYLVHHRGESVHKERIVEDLWPDMNMERSTTYMHTCIYQIRKTIKAYGLDRRISVNYSNDSYLITMQGIRRDTDEFLEIIENKGEITEASIQLYEKAASLYRGHYLEENDYPWSVHFKQQLFLHYIEIVQSMSVYYMSRRMFVQAVLHLQQFIAKDPFQEETHALLLKCYGEMGDRAGLLEHYHHMKRLFTEELGMELPPRMESLMNELLGKL